MRNEKCGMWDVECGMRNEELGVLLKLKYNIIKTEI
jgi:hypothetical protein